MRRRKGLPAQRRVRAPFSPAPRSQPLPHELHAPQSAPDCVAYTHSGLPRARGGDEAASTAATARVWHAFFASRHPLAMPTHTQPNVDLSVIPRERVASHPRSHRARTGSAMSHSAGQFVDKALRATCAIAVVKSNPWVDRVYLDTLSDAQRRTIQPSHERTNAAGRRFIYAKDTSDRDRKVSLPNGDVRHVAIQGSGLFLEASTGLLLTAEHVRRDCRDDCITYASEYAKLVVCPYLGGELDWCNAWEAEVVAHTGSWDPADKRNLPEPGLAAGMLLRDLVDAALLRPTCELMTGTPVSTPVRIPGATAEITALPISTAPLKTVQALYILGFPTGGGKMTPTPVPAGYSLDETDPAQAEGKFLKITGGEILPGHSGGPIVTDSGVCVAWSVRKGRRVNHVRPIEAANACIELALPCGVSWTAFLATEAQEAAHATSLQTEARAASVAAATQAVAGPASDATDASQKAQQAAIEANATAAALATHQAKDDAQQTKVDKTLREIRMALVMKCSHLSLEEQHAIMLRLAGVVPQELTAVATLARIKSSCILILEVPGSFAQAAQDAACARPEELAACGLLALRVAGQNAVALCAAGSHYIERLMAIDFSLFHTPIATDEFVQTASAPPLAAARRGTRPARKGGAAHMSAAPMDVEVPPQCPSATACVLLHARALLAAGTAIQGFARPHQAPACCGWLRRQKAADTGWGLPDGGRSELGDGEGLSEARTGVSGPRGAARKEAVPLQPGRCRCRSPASV